MRDPGDADANDAAVWNEVIYLLLVAVFGLLLYELVQMWL